MRPISVSVGAVGSSPWIPLEYAARTFDVGLFASLSEDASGITYSVEQSPDNPSPSRATSNPVISLTRSTTTATLTFTNPHGLVATDSVVVTGSGDPNLDGTYAVASTPTTKSLTYTVANTGLAAALAGVQAAAMRVFALAAGLTAATTRQAGSIVAPCFAVRLRVSAWTAGQATLQVIQGLARG